MTKKTEEPNKTCWNCAGQEVCMHLNNAVGAVADALWDTKPDWVKPEVAASIADDVSSLIGNEFGVDCPCFIPQQDAP